MRGRRLGRHRQLHRRRQRHRHCSTASAGFMSSAASAGTLCSAAGTLGQAQESIVALHCWQLQRRARLNAGDEILGQCCKRCLRA